MASSSRVTLDASSAATDTDNSGLAIPSSFYILPPVAATIGLVIGMRRGGNRARLQFLAENAHRLPKTTQGWYFYTKTRNYKVMLRGVQMGGRYAAALGTATLAYAALEEYIGYERERWTGTVVPRRGEGEGLRKRVTWRLGGVAVWDGVLAGLALSIAVGTIFRLPRQLVVRSVGLGTILGGVESAAQIARDEVGSRGAERIAATHSIGDEPIAHRVSPDHPIVDRPVEYGDQANALPIDESSFDPAAEDTLPPDDLAGPDPQHRSVWTRLRSWTTGRS